MENKHHGRRGLIDVCIQDLMNTRFLKHLVVARNFKHYTVETCWSAEKYPGQQIRSQIDSFQNANFLISQPNPMMLPLIEIVSERRFQ